MLTAYLRTDRGEQTLFPVQAWALAELHDNGGLFGSVPVGGGKTLISLLAAVMLDSKCCLIVVPAPLFGKLTRELGDLSRHWKIPLGRITPMSYSKLGIGRWQTFLEDLKPDLIVLDEAHNLKRLGSVRTRRFVRYMKQNPQTRVVALSGTMTNSSLFDYYHLAKWALPLGCPLPHTESDLTDWDAVIGVRARDEFQTVEPGALLQFCAPGEDVRQGFARRLAETPGVITLPLDAPDDVAASLVVYGVELDLPPALKALLAQMRREWVTPWGEEMQDRAALWRHARQVSCGFYYRWIWPEGTPDTEWLEARAAWHRACRRICQRGEPGLDSEALLVKAIKEERYRCDLYWPWDKVKDRYGKHPPVEAVWLDDFLVDHAADWAHSEQGLVWYEHRAVGERLAQKHGLPLYGPGKAAAQALETQGRGASVVSIKAHGTGRNLQHQWSKNLVTSCIPNGSQWEQLLGRTHRFGQRADEVTVHVYLHTREQRECFEKARAEAEYQQHSMRQPQRLLKATLVLPDPRGAGQ